MTVPRPLAALLAASLLLGFSWALFVPGGQSPDEPAHLAYVQVLAERGNLPKPDVSVAKLRETAFSTEQKLARDWAHEQWQYAQPRVKSQWDPRAERRWMREDDGLGPRARSDGGGPNSASGNPPLYYAYETLPYHAASGGRWYDRLFAMRMWSVLLLGIAVVATWLLAGELTGRDRLSQVIAAGVVGLQPMATFISASVNPDAGLIALWVVAFWLGVRVMREAHTRDVAALLVVTVAALLTKASSLGLLIGVTVALGVAARRRLAGRRLAKRWVFGLGAGLVLLVVAAGLGASGRVGEFLGFSPRDVPRFVSYLWQAYFPNLPGQDALPGLAAAHGYDTWIVSAWAAFGWLEVQFPQPVYWLLTVISGVLIVAGALAVRRGDFPVDRAVIAFFAVSAAALVAALHWAEYRHLVTGQGALLQGRYLLPLLPIGGLLTAAAVSRLRADRRPAAAAVVLGGLFVAQVFSLGLVAARFYV